MRFWTFATVLLVVALVITDVSARKSNRDRRTAKNGKQKQNDFHASRQEEERVDGVFIGEKKAKQMLHSKERKRRSVEKEEPKYERKEFIAATKNTEPLEDKEQTSAKSEVEQVGHQFGQRRTELDKKSGKVEKLRKSKEIVEDTVDSTEGFVPNSKKSRVKGNWEKPSKTGKRDSQVEKQAVRSGLKKDKEESEKSKLAKKNKITKVEEAAIEETDNMVETMKNKEIKERTNVEGDSTCNDELEIKNTKKCTCDEDVAQERTEEEEVEPEETEELASCRGSTTFKSDKYAEKKHNKSCKSN